MTEATHDQGIHLGNPQEVLASCLVKSHDVYLKLVDEGFSSDLYREVGRTTRCLAQCLSETSIAYDEVNEDMDDLDTEGLAELEEEEQD